MAQPTAYVPQTDFSNDEAANQGGRSTVRTANLDTEFLNIAATLTGVLVNLSLNQRDDGQIRDQRVTVAALSTAVVALFTSIGVIVRGAWLTATAYAVKDIVVQNTNTYICGTAHTSGTFATDLAAGKWVLLALGLGGGSFGGAALTGITDLTTTGNTVVGDATTDTFNAGANGIVKDASGNVGFGLLPALFIEALRTQNAQTPVRVSNLSGGNAAHAAFLTQADVPGAMFATYGSGHASRPSQTWVVTNTAQALIFGINDVEKARISAAGNFYTADGKIGPNDTQRHTMPAVASDTFALLAAAQTLTNKTVGSTGLFMSNVVQAALNNLDWIEKATAWTPIITFGGASVGMVNASTGLYARIGNVVFFAALVGYTAFNKGSSTGVAAIAGLPYTAAASLNVPVTVNMLSLLTPVSGYPGAQVVFSSKTIALYDMASGGAATQLTEAKFSAGAAPPTIYIQGMYFV